MPNIQKKGSCMQVHLRQDDFTNYALDTGIWVALCDLAGIHQSDAHDILMNWY